jgi:heme exporter protein A
MIEVKKLIKIFGAKKVLRSINFNADTGDFIALLGPNGAGKSTFLRILASLLRPTSGQVLIAGHKLPNDAASLRSHLGVVTHQPLLYGDLTAKENLLFFGRLFGIQNLNNRVSEVLELVGLTSRSRDLVRTFSRGMQQRLSIGRAILHDPDVLLFDEPHTGLDQDACDMLDKLLREVATSGRTVVMTSHDLYRVESLANRFDVLSKGVITASARHDEFHGNLLDFYREVINS